MEEKKSAKKPKEWMRWTPKKRLEVFGDLYEDLSDQCKEIIKKTQSVKKVTNSKTKKTTDRTIFITKKDFAKKHPDLALFYKKGLQLLKDEIQSEKDLERQKKKTLTF